MKIAASAATATAAYCAHLVDQSYISSRRHQRPCHIHAALVGSHHEWGVAVLNARHTQKEKERKKKRKTR